MIGLVEVARNVICHIFFTNCLEVCQESINYTIHGLSYILHSTCLAFNAINEVATFTSDIFLAFIGAISEVAGDRATVINEWAIVAFFVVASVSALTVGCGSLFHIMVSRLTLGDFGPDQYVSKVLWLSFGHQYVVVKRSV